MFSNSILLAKKRKFFEKLETLVDFTMTDLSFRFSPRVSSGEEVKRIFENAFYGSI